MRVRAKLTRSLIWFGSAIAAFAFMAPSAVAALPTTQGSPLPCTAASPASSDIRFCDLSGMNLAGADFHGRNLFFVSFQSSRLDGANLSNSSGLLPGSLSNASLVGADLSNVRDIAFCDGADFSEANLSGASFTGGDSVTGCPAAKFRGATVCSTVLQLGKFAGADFSDLKRGSECVESILIRKASGLPDSAAYMKGIDLQGANFKRADLRGSRLAGSFRERVNLRNADFTDANLEEAKLDRLDMAGITATGTNFTHASLTHAILKGADLTRAQFASADLNYANIADATVSQTEFARAFFGQIQSRNLIGIPASLPVAVASAIGMTFPVVLSGGCLTGAITLDAIIQVNCGTSWANRDMHGQTLQDLNLAGSNLRGINLAGATLRRVSLEDADLTGADLTGATIMRTSLDRADLTGVKLKDVTLDETRFDDPVSLDKAKLAGADLRGFKGVFFGNPESLPTGFRLAKINTGMLNKDGELGRLVGRGISFANVYMIPWGGATDFTDLDLHGVNIRPATLWGDWARSNFSGANLQGSALVGSFGSTNFSGADLSGSNVNFSDFTNANMSYAKLGGANIDRVTLTGADLSGVTGVPLKSWSRAVAVVYGDPKALPSGWFVLSLKQGCTLGCEYLSDAARLLFTDSVGMRLDSVDLAVTKVFGQLDTSSPFPNSRKWQVNRSNLLAGANLAGLNLTGGNLQAAVLTNTNLTASNLTGVDLSSIDAGGTSIAPDAVAAAQTPKPSYGVRLRGANLLRAKLDKAKLRFALLSGAKSGGITGIPTTLPTGWVLSGGFLLGPKADLRGASLSNVDFRTAVLDGANLTGANVAGANFSLSKLAGIVATRLVGTPARMPTGWKLVKGSFVKG